MISILPALVAFAAARFAFPAWLTSLLGMAVQQLPSALTPSVMARLESEAKTLARVAITAFLDAGTVRRVALDVMADVPVFEPELLAVVRASGLIANPDGSFTLRQEQQTEPIG